MKTKDLQQLSKEELLNKLAEVRGEIRDLRFAIKTRQNSKVRNLRNARKDLARILTILSLKK